MITWTLTEQEADTIGRALYAMPYGQVAALVAKLQQQANPPPKKAAVPASAGAEDPDD